MSTVLQNQKNHKAVFTVYNSMGQVKTAFKSLKKLGLSTKNFSFFQPIEGDQDFPQVQKYQLKNGALIGGFLGTFIIGGMFLYIGYRLHESQTLPFNLFVLGGFLAGMASLIIGGIVGAACGILAGIGTPDPVGKRYGQLLHAGGILVSVQPDNSIEAEKTLHVLEAIGGADPHIADEQSTWKEAIQENVKLLEKEQNRASVESLIS